MGDSPVVVGPYSSDSVEVGVTDAQVTTANQRGYISVGFDGSNYRFVRINASGQQIIVGAGTAGTPAGGVLSVQGVSGGQALPISAASLPLPSGAATEATLATLLTESTFTTRVPVLALGGGVEAGALRVTIANDSTGVLSVDDNGGSLTVDTSQLPGALVGGRLDTNVGAWLGSTAPTVGQKAMVASVPIVIASDQSPVDVAQSGTWTVQQGTPPWTVAGTDADGAAPTENPVLAAGWDGTNVRTLEQRNEHPATDDYGLVVREVERTVPTFYVVFDRITMSLNKYLATLFNTSATRKVVVQRIWVLNWQAANVPGGPVFHELYRITARTAGTAVTPRAEDTNDALSAGISADTNSSAVTTDHLIMRVTHSGEELGFGSDTHNLLGLPVHALRYERRRGQRGLTLRQNQGISIQSVGGDLDGTTSVIYEFTDEVV